MAEHVDLIQEATRLMRQRAEAATEGPWTAHPDGLVWPQRLGDPVSGSTQVEDAEHIASWHPSVVLLVADWLDLVAQSWVDPKTVKHYQARQRNQEKALAVGSRLPRGGGPWLTWICVPSGRRSALPNWPSRMSWESHSRRSGTRGWVSIQLRWRSGSGGRTPAARRSRRWVSGTKRWPVAGSTGRCPVADQVEVPDGVRS